jgi:hypothetical protein
MEVIKKFPEDMDARTAYKLMKSPAVKKISEAEGSVLQIQSWIQYNSTDRETGEVKEVLAIETPDGEMFATISKVFREEFLDMVEYFGPDLGAIEIIAGTSKAGRNYFTCSIA